MRRVVVTGARGGIGEAATNEVLSLGGRIYGTGSFFDETSRIAATLPDPVAAVAAFAARLPTRRRARAEEQPNVIACLASKEASFITGSILDIDGGSDLVTVHVGPGSHAGSDTTWGVAGHFGALWVLGDGNVRFASDHGLLDCAEAQAGLTRGALK